MNPWERQPNESTKAYAAFMAYMELGPGRSIEKALLGQNRGRSGVSWWEQWSGRYRWVERATAYDDHVFRQKLASRTEVLERARQRAVDAMDDVLDAMIHLAQGEADNSSAQVSAAKLVVTIAGMSEKLALEHSGPNGMPIATKDETPRPIGQPNTEQAKEILRILVETGAVASLCGDGEPPKVPDGTGSGD